jgi:Ca-activated chloride channel family protein
MEPGQYHRYRSTNSGNPLPLDLPDEPGTYEIRYVLGQSNTVLATRIIIATPVSATLQAPDTFQSGGRIEVSWTGPGNRNDFIAIASPDMEPGQYHRYRSTNSGNPLPLDLPDEPGTYEIRYVLGQSNTVLATRTITITPASEMEM